MSDVRRQVKASRAQEERGMAAMGGQRHRGSGANWSRKADGRTNGPSWTSLDHTLVEFKRTDAKQITLKAKDLEKIIYEATLEGRAPVMGIEVGGRNYVLLEESDYLEMKHGLDEGSSLRG